MKLKKHKMLITTCIICLLPIIFGVLVWGRLPDTLAIHFNLNGEPDNFASKGFVVFVLPLLMALLQIFCYALSKIDSKKYGNKKFEGVTMWIIPVLTATLYILTLGYGLGWNIDIRIAVMLIVLFLIAVTVWEIIARKGQ